jgi:hypothetical protein
MLAKHLPYLRRIPVWTVALPLVMLAAVWLAIWPDTLGEWGMCLMAAGAVVQAWSCGFWAAGAMLGVSQD